MIIWVDGRELEVPRDTLLYDAVISAGVEVPALCRHGGLQHEGACRVCVVEVESRGSSKLVASCMYPVREEGLKVRTDTERVLKARRFVIGLLLRRNGASPVVKALAERWGAMDVGRLEPMISKDLCVRCMRCVRACGENGFNAISFSKRGWDRQVGPPLEEAAEACVGCLACAEVCPTGHITYRESDGVREIWGRRFQLVECPSCGARFATLEQLRALGTWDPLCPSCRRREEAGSLGLG
ncbi:NADH:ubiquinone oxidoreductase chain G-like protein [Thermanaerovibrio velox DSM 12556]|uniref:NADH:ubiquinone oxidoreductase chain G-like protein n=1 Tax=Thermanaerovibrio velox DSM 12556 TaxID=926567 RepID=H0UNP0_9BACT|nr:2Fe-2S iron-sulfur cluster-binding protein [Thermanaerovibrio velox]EHM10455.1 NADH:ubiquinone oxidoreductase chain G-like protein [Thermanaerovibrio velox DSM 12556]